MMPASLFRLPALLLLAAALVAVFFVHDARPAEAQSPTVSLSVTPNPVEEGSSVTVRVTLSAPTSQLVEIPVTLTLDSAEEADLDAMNLLQVRGGFSIAIAETHAEKTLATELDADTDDETFTVSLGTLPSGYTAGDVTSVTVTIQDAGWLSDLEVLDEYGSLVMRPSFNRSHPEQAQVVFVAPGISRVKIKPYWPEGSGVTLTVSTTDITYKDRTYSTATVTSSGTESGYLTISSFGGTKLNISLAANGETLEYPKKYVTRELNAANADNYVNSMGVSPNPNARPTSSLQRTGAPGYFNVLHRSGSSVGGLIRNVSYQSAGPLTSSWLPASGYPRILPSDPYTADGGAPQQNSGSITLTPAFDRYVQEYTATVPHEVSSVFVNLSLSHHKATATVNGNSPSTPVSLQVGENVVTVVVTAESGVQRTYTVTITREPSNRPLTVASAIADETIINESGTRQVSLSDVFSDADGDALTVTASSSDESTATVSVSADQSTLTVTARNRGAATVTVTASDGNGGEASDTFTVTVKAAPVVASAIADISGLEAEDSRTISMSGVFSDADGDSLTVTASSSDGARATVSVASDGSRLTVTAVAVGTATITVTARDSDGNRVSDAFEVVVVGKYVDEDPVLSGSAAVSYAENGTDPVATYTATDPQGGAITWSLSGDDAGAFTLTGGVLAFRTSPDYETPADTGADNVYEVTVTAADPDGLSNSIDVTVTVTDTNENRPPAFPSSETGARSVAELTAANTPIGAPVRAEDPDRDTLTYSLGGTDMASFGIVTGTGQLQSHAALDYESKASYSVTVTATDPDGLSDSIDVTITVTDVDEDPVLSGSAAVSYAENGTGPVETYTATDPQGGAITWSLSGDDAGAFTIVGGVLAFRTSPDYETPADTGADNVYEVTVAAADPSGLSNSIDVAITVTDVDETGPEQTLLERYDADSSGAIEQAEVMTAINDYLFGTGDDAISKAEVIEVINLYLFGS